MGGSRFIKAIKRPKIADYVLRIAIILQWVRKMCLAFWESWQKSAIKAGLLILSCVPQTLTLASDWWRLITWPGHWPLIGQDSRRDKDTGLSLVTNFVLRVPDIRPTAQHVWWTRASDWWRVVTWPGYWPLIGQHAWHHNIIIATILHTLNVSLSLSSKS